MHCLRDGHAVDCFLADSTEQELKGLIQGRIAELAEYEDTPLSELVNFVILEPTDTKIELERVSGRPLNVAALDSFEAHTTWFELTAILRDDGFGNVIYIPRDIKDEPLRQLCQTHCTEPSDEDST
jgi:hypothetical protein